MFGSNKDANGVCKFGNENLKVNDDKIFIGNQHWVHTPGLFELLFCRTNEFPPNKL